MTCEAFPSPTIPLDADADARLLGAADLLQIFSMRGDACEVTSRETRVVADSSEAAGRAESIQ